MCANDGVQALHHILGIRKLCCSDSLCSLKRSCKSHSTNNIKFHLVLFARQHIRPAHVVTPTRIGAHVNYSSCRHAPKTRSSTCRFGASPQYRSIRRTHFVSGGGVSSEFLDGPAIESWAAAASPATAHPLLFLFRSEEREVIVQNLTSGFDFRIVKVHLERYILSRRAESRSSKTCQQRRISGWRLSRRLRSCRLSSRLRGFRRLSAMVIDLLRGENHFFLLRGTAPWIRGIRISALVMRVTAF